MVYKYNETDVQLADRNVEQFWVSWYAEVEKSAWDIGGSVWVLAQNKTGRQLRVS